MVNDQNTQSENTENLTEEELVQEAIRRGQESAELDIKAQLEAAKAQNEELLARIRELEDERESIETDEDLKERMIRLQADWENFRRRTARERIEERERACEKLIVNMLPVLDDMERALDHAQSEAEGNEQLKNFCEGVLAIYAKALDILGKEGLEKMQPLGEPFDPNEHRAVGRVEDADMFEESVHDVYQNGYRMGSKVIREAMVAVSFGGPVRPAETAEEVEEVAEVVEEEISENN